MDRDGRITDFGLLRPVAALYNNSSRRSKGQFRRGGTSLYKTLPISLSDALLGFERNVTHMDGRTVTVKRDGVTQTGFVLFMTCSL